MTNLLNNPYIKKALLVAYVLVQGIFLGRMIFTVMPYVSWPFNVVVGYAIGIITSVYIASIISKLRGSLQKRCVYAFIGLLGVILVSSTVIYWVGQIQKLLLQDSIG
jgi:hypothetical protein